MQKIHLTHKETWIQISLLLISLGVPCYSEAVFISAAKEPQADQQRHDTRGQTTLNQVGVTVEYNESWH